MAAAPKIASPIREPAFPRNRWIIALVVTMATFMELLDTSIANVSLPHIAGGLSTSYDEATWVLTSYLVSNAIKYSPIGGKISVTVAHEDDNTVIRVTDQGAGPSPEDLGRLFGRFQRLSAKPTAGESSTGLGLSIVKRIIDMHGGEVTAASPGPNKGSTFTVTLPAADQS